MLTLILLVVLGGGVGLLAVTLAESPKPATDGGRIRRAQKPSDAHEEAEPTAEAAPAPTPTPRSDREPNPKPNPEPNRVPAPAATRVVEADAGPPRQASRGDVPKAFTAVEGRLQDVAAAPLWRRLVSLVLIVIIAVGVGVAIAAIAAAIIGAAAEIVGNTIG